MITQFMIFRLHGELGCTSAPEYNGYRNRNRKLLISRAPTKAKSEEPAYSQALNQKQNDWCRLKEAETIHTVV